MTDAPGYRETRATLSELVVCASSWEPDARLLGNITAEGIVAACTNILVYLDRAEAELAEATARAEKAEAERDVLVACCMNKCPSKEVAMRCVSNQKADCVRCWLTWAAQEAAKRGEK